MVVNKRPVAYLVWCRGLGYFHKSGTCWTGINEAMRFESHADAERAALNAVIREPHLMGEVEAVECYIDHWGKPKT